MTLLNEDYTLLAHAPVVRGSVKVTSAANFTSSTTYTEGTDYEVVYPTGEIRRLSSGSITSGQKVYVSYQYIKEGPFTVREESIDRSD